MTDQPPPAPDRPTGHPATLMLHELSSVDHYATHPTFAGLRLVFYRHPANPRGGLQPAS